MNQNEVTQEIIALLGYPCQVIESGNLTEVYRQAYLKGQKEGFTPVLISADDTLLDALTFDEESTPETILQNLPDGKEILNQLWDSATAYGEPDDDNDEFEEILYFKGDSGRDSFNAGGHDGQIILFEIPTKNPWEIPAYVPFGGFNECPTPQDMTAICKYWFEKYHAVPAVITYDTLEMILPVSVSEENLDELVREQYVFCPDIVDQTTGTLSFLKADLVNATVWSFWWD